MSRSDLLETASADRVRHFPRMDGSLLVVRIDRSRQHYLADRPEAIDYRIDEFVNVGIRPTSNFTTEVDKDAPSNTTRLRYQSLRERLLNKFSLRHTSGKNVL